MTTQRTSFGLSRKNAQAMMVLRIFVAQSSLKKLFKKETSTVLIKSLKKIKFDRRSRTNLSRALRLD